MNEGVDDRLAPDDRSEVNAKGFGIEFAPITAQASNRLYGLKLHRTPLLFDGQNQRFNQRVERCALVESQFLGEVSEVVAEPVEQKAPKPPFTGGDIVRFHYGTISRPS